MFNLFFCAFCWGIKVLTNAIAFSKEKAMLSERSLTIDNFSILLFIALFLNMMHQTGSITSGYHESSAVLKYNTPL